MELPCLILPCIIRVSDSDFSRDAVIPEFFSFPYLDSQMQFLLIRILVNFVKHRFAISLLIEIILTLNCNSVARKHCSVEEKSLFALMNVNVTAAEVVQFQDLTPEIKFIS